jgi:hypothetical protein
MKERAKKKHIKRLTADAEGVKRLRRMAVRSGMKAGLAKSGERAKEF